MCFWNAIFNQSPSKWYNDSSCGERFLFASKPMMKRIFIFMLLALVLFAGCTYVDPLYRLKNSRLEFNRDVTLEQAFTRYPFFVSTKWEEIGRTDGNALIEVESVLDLNKCPVEIDEGQELSGVVAEKRKAENYRVVFQWLDRTGRFILAGFGSRYVLNGKPVDDIQRLKYENQEAFQKLQMIYAGTECVR